MCFCKLDIILRCNSLISNVSKNYEVTMTWKYISILYLSISQSPDSTSATYRWVLYTFCRFPITKDHRQRRSSVAAGWCSALSPAHVPLVRELSVCIQYARVGCPAMGGVLSAGVPPMRRRASCPKSPR